MVVPELLRWYYVCPLGFRGQLCSEMDLGVEATSTPFPHIHQGKTTLGKVGRITTGIWWHRCPVAEDCQEHS